MGGVYYLVGMSGAEALKKVCGGGELKRLKKTFRNEERRLVAK